MSDTKQPCPYCRGAKRIYAHVQDDTGIECPYCSPLKKPTGARLPILEEAQAEHDKAIEQIMTEREIAEDALGEIAEIMGRGLSNFYGYPQLIEDVEYAKSQSDELEAVKKKHAKEIEEVQAAVREECCRAVKPFEPDGADEIELAIRSIFFATGQQAIKRIKEE